MSGKMGDSHNLVQILTDHFGPAGGHMHTGVEIGVHRGELSAKLLRAFPGLSLLWMIDAWAAYPEKHPYRESGDSCSKLTYDEQSANMKAARISTEFAGARRSILRLPSLTAVQRIPTPRLSWVFIDGDHTEQAVREDIAAWWPRIEARGLLVGHDWGHRRFPGVKVAVEEFAAREGVAIHTLGSCWLAAKL